MRDLNAEQLAALERGTTMPLYLIELGLGETRFYATSRDVNVDDRDYVSGIVGISGMSNWQEVQLDVINADYQLTNVILSGVWRGQMCRVLWVPVVQELYFEAGYVEPGYYDPIVYGEPVLIMDGELVSASIAQRITLTGRAKGLSRSWTTRQRIEAPTFNHLPAPGTTVTVNGETFTIEAAL